VILYHLKNGRYETDTPIQKAIAEIEERINATMRINEYSEETKIAIKTGLRLSQTILQSQVPYERECIEGAYKEGEAVGLNHCIETAHDFFTQTFKTNPQGGGGE